MNEKVCFFIGFCHEKKKISQKDVTNGILLHIEIF